MSPRDFVFPRTRPPQVSGISSSAGKACTMYDVYAWSNISTTSFRRRRRCDADMLPTGDASENMTRTQQTVTAALRVGDAMATGVTRTGKASRRQDTQRLLVTQRRWQ
eukprot:m.384959 g.384959  ORF g.384959 m.384959 type:complete len:108 (-) comp20050_c6_seq3:391-714(-)